MSNVEKLILKSSKDLSNNDINTKQKIKSYFLPEPRMWKIKINDHQIWKNFKTGTIALKKSSSKYYLIPNR